MATKKPIKVQNASIFNNISNFNLLSFSDKPIACDISNPNTRDHTIPISPTQH